MILLDTNVISEFTRPKPNLAVTTWLAKQTYSEVFLSAITEAELRYGVAILPMGKRRRKGFTPQSRKNRDRKTVGAAKAAKRKEKLTTLPPVA